MYRVKIKPNNEDDFVGNQLTFGTIELAREYATDLSSRWILVEKWIIVDEGDRIVYFWPTYRPTDRDVQWTKNVIDLVKNGGVWGWPDTGLFYVFRHSVKVLQLKNPEMIERDPILYEKHRQAVETFKVLGWTVLPSQDTD